MPTLQELIAKRDKYLEEHPNLKQYQQELDELLDKVPADKRMEVIGFKMAGNLIELNKAFGELAEHLIKK